PRPLPTPQPTPLTAPPTPRPTLPPLLRTKWPTRLKRPPNTRPTSPRTPPTWPTRRRTRLKSPKTRSDPSWEPPGFPGHGKDRDRRETGGPFFVPAAGPAKLTAVRSERLQVVRAGERTLHAPPHLHAVFTSVGKDFLPSNPPRGFHR